MPILTPEQLASVRTLLMDGVDANDRLIYEIKKRIDDESSEPVTMEYVGDLAVHAQRLPRDR
jgi:hypothetical protein